MSAPSSDKAGIRQTIRALRAAGYALDSVNNGGDDNEPVTTEEEAIAEATASDSAALYVTRDGESSYVYFVLGNDPEEVVCNYTVDLEPVLGPLTEGWWN